MFKLKETSLEWALLHLLKYPDSDQFPRLFEFECIKHDWDRIRAYLLGLDIENYAPNTPEVMLAQKPNGNYRVVHQLHPFDSLIYAALVHEVSGDIENFRIPENRNIACSYRIDTSVPGQFFNNVGESYNRFMNQSLELAKLYPDGFVLVCDIVDFYNQINLHRVNNVLEEAGTKSGSVVERFLLGVNTNTSQGIPVGPYASIVLAEAIMADIDKKILTFTDLFTRYVDDIYVFFRTKEEATIILHHLTKYLYENHRLVLSADKTCVIETSVFLNKYIQNQETIDKQLMHGKIEHLRTGHYSDPEELREFDDLEPPEKFKVRAETYRDRFEEALRIGKLDLGVMRHIIRQAGGYKVRSILPLILVNFTFLLPVLPDVVVYMKRVLTDKVVVRFEKEFAALLSNSFINLPLVNLWVYSLFQHDAFKVTSINIDYSSIYRIREKALIALRQRNTTWVKDIKSGLDTLGSWDRRAVIYAASILSSDEAKHWLALEAAKKDELNSAICKKVIADKAA